MKGRSVDKVAVIGAGNVGATLAMRIVESGLADAVLVDIERPIAEGKALDVADTAGIVRGARSIVGTDEYSHIQGSKVVAITAGLARKPGMSRDDLVSKNAAIVKGVVEKVRMNAPEAVIVVVTNPLDAMTYLAYKASSFGRERVLGMAGLLDESRFIGVIARELKVSPGDVRTVIMGSHGDTMVPILSHTTVGKKDLRALMPKEKIDELIRTTRSRGAQIVNLLGSGSAYYSPALATFKMVEAVMKDTKEVITASCYLEGEYGFNDICIGVPVRVGRKGIESVVELTLTEDEKAALGESARALRRVIESLSLS